MTSKIENVQIEITRAYESSGNVQFFVRARRLDDKDSIFGNILEHQCFQTKYLETEDKCIDYAIFDVDFLLRFFGHKAEDVKFIGFTDENMESVKNAKRFWRDAN